MDTISDTNKIDWVARARSLQDLIIASANETEAQGKVTSEVMEALHDVELFRMALPRSIGGGEAEPLTLMKTIEAIAEADASTAWCVGLGTIAVVFSAIFYASSQTATKSLSNTDTPNAILFYMGIIFIFISSGPAIYVWEMPSSEDIIPILLLGIFGYLAHAFIIRALASADASYVMPFDFLRLPIAAVFGLFLYGEWPDLWVWTGAAVIFSATYYITWHEKRSGAGKTN